MDRIKSKLHLHCLMWAFLIITLVPFLTGFDITRHVFVEVVGLTKLEDNALHLLGLKANVAYGHLVRSTRAHTIDVELTFCVCYCHILSA